MAAHGAVSRLEIVNGELPGRILGHGSEASRHPRQRGFGVCAPVVHAGLRSLPSRSCEFSETADYQGFAESGRRVSNPRPSAWEAEARHPVPVVTDDWVGLKCP